MAEPSIVVVVTFEPAMLRDYAIELRADMLEDGIDAPSALEVEQELLEGWAAELVERAGPPEAAPWVHAIGEVRRG